MRRLLLVLLLMLGTAMVPVAPATATAANAFDHRHAAWDALLAKHVRVLDGGNASQVRYTGMQVDRALLAAYLASLSAVTEADYASWSRSLRLAFLINAYNAFTVELVLGKYPDLKSIKDLGSVFQSPWKKTFFTLLGEQRSLDDVEHGLVRAPGAFDDPRIHVALVCASVGCPMLRNEAFTGERLDAQLDDAMRRFFADRSRNRFDSANGKLQVSKIFDWYGKDFAQGHAGFDSLAATFARYAEQLADTPGARARVRSGDYRLEFLDYDWRLNDAP
ncbi:MAG TPA: DUF547 domain-containing protein [Accumulibacter sp.]|uniref:DUF547 domain-containing protein n=1 Tax=Accumulibacter sp. TaxID=2053492 RepID=UPI000EC14F2D|nr:DUF547 domain-containing protein [Accumulibacter sp.]HCZ15103.1 DUF547 domain-containing protein [Accumulibacter sp.]HRF73686.1 DUF547 domain-containing protein [Accumulibacter sp.]